MHQAGIFLCLFAVAFAGVIEPQPKKSYDGYKVFRLKVETEAQLNYFQYLFENDTSLRLDFWRVPTKLDQSIDVMVPPGSLDSLIDAMGELQIHYEVKIDDVQQAIEKEEEGRKFSASLARDAVAGAEGASFNFRTYHTLAEIEEFMSSLQRRFPNIVEILDLGRTWEGRTISAIKIANKARVSEPNRPIFWLDGGIHAREWIAPAVAVYIMNELVTKYSVDQRITRFVDEMDFVILPVVNPDGYEYSRTRDRMWRKNRNPNGNQRFNWCWGVDLNRNFDWHFGGKGSSFDPCQEIYSGKTAFSEPESRAIRDYILANNDRMQAFITLHSFSQIWMYPYGHEYNKKAEDWQDLKAVADKASRQLASLYGTNYVVDTGANSLYPAAGGSDDWSKGVGHVKFVYLLELRPSDNSPDAIYGFLLPESQILPTSMETWSGLQVVAEEIMSRTGRGSGLPIGTNPPAALTTEEPADSDTKSNACKDRLPRCQQWVRERLKICTKMAAYMKLNCAKSCNLC
jgi:hypothetical protein